MIATGTFTPDVPGPMWRPPALGLGGPGGPQFGLQPRPFLDGNGSGMFNGPESGPWPGSTSTTSNSLVATATFVNGNIPPTGYPGDRYGGHGMLSYGGGYGQQHGYGGYIDYGGGDYPDGYPMGYDASPYRVPYTGNSGDGYNGNYDYESGGYGGGKGGYNDYGPSFGGGASYTNDNGDHGSLIYSSTSYNGSGGGYSDNDGDSCGSTPFNDEGPGGNDGTEYGPPQQQQPAFSSPTVNTSQSPLPTNTVNSGPAPTSTNNISPDVNPTPSGSSGNTDSSSISGAGPSLGGGPSSPVQLLEISRPLESNRSDKNASFAGIVPALLLMAVWFKV